MFVGCVELEDESFMNEMREYEYCYRKPLLRIGESVFIASEMKF